MRRGLVRRWRLRRSIDLDEHEARGIVGVLDHIEARHAGFLDALARILNRRRFECFDVPGLHLHVNMNDTHDEIVYANSPA